MDQATTYVTALGWCHVWMSLWLRPFTNPKASHPTPLLATALHSTHSTLLHSSALHPFIQLSFHSTRLLSSPLASINGMARSIHSHIHSTPCHFSPLQSKPLPSLPLHSAPFHSAPLQSTHSTALHFLGRRVCGREKRVRGCAGVDRGDAAGHHYLVWSSADRSLCRPEGHRSAHPSRAPRICALLLYKCRVRQLARMIYLYQIYSHQNIRLLAA